MQEKVAAVNIWISISVTKAFSSFTFCNCRILKEHKFSTCVTPVTVLWVELLSECPSPEMWRRGQNRHIWIGFKSLVWVILQEQIVMVMYRKLQINHCIIAIRQNLTAETSSLIYKNRKVFVVAVRMFTHFLSKICPKYFTLLTAR